MDRLTPVTLAAGGWQATVLPDFGANLVGLSHQGKPYLRSPGSLDELRQSPCLYGCPLLFPANRTDGGCFSLDGQTYRLPINEPARGNHIHGLLLDAPFAVAARSGSRLVCTLDNRGEYFPFPFGLAVEFLLEPWGLTQTITFTNTGSRRMPLPFALHTAFVTPRRVAVPVGQRYQWDDRFLPTGRLLALSGPEALLPTGLEQPDELPLSGYYTALDGPAQLDELLYQPQGPFDHWVVFNGGGGRGFLCVEPQCGPVNVLAAGSPLLLAPGSAQIFTLCFSLRQEEDCNVT